MVNHLHLAGHLVTIAIFAAAGGTGLVLHELFFGNTKPSKEGPAPEGKTGPQLDGVW